MSAWLPWTAFGVVVLINGYFLVLFVVGCLDFLLRRRRSDDHHLPRCDLKPVLRDRLRACFRGKHGRP